MLVLIALLLAPPPAEAAFAIADGADEGRVQLLAEFAERWPKAPLGPKALRTALTLAKTPAERLSTGRAALVHGQLDGALRMLGTDRDATSLTARQALSIALADAGRLLQALDLAQDSQVADALADDRVRAGQASAAAAAVLASTTKRGHRMAFGLRRIQQLSPDRRGAFLAHLAPGFLLLSAPAHAATLPAWKRALGQLSAKPEPVRRVPRLRPLPRWSITSVESRAELAAELAEAEAHEHSDLLLQLAEFEAVAGRPVQARVQVLAAWEAYQAVATEDDDDSLTAFVDVWLALGDWAQVRTLLRRMEDPAAGLNAVTDAIFAHGASDQLSAFVPIWLGAGAAGCTPTTDNFDAILELLEWAHLGDRTAAIDAAIAHIQSPVLANRARMAQMSELLGDEAFQRAFQLLRRLDTRCPQDAAERRDAWQDVLEQVVSVDRHRLALTVLGEMLKRRIPVPDWLSLTEPMHAAGFGAALADVVLAHSTPTARAAWLTAVFDNTDVTASIMALGPRLNGQRLTPEQKEAVAQARADRPTVEPMLEDANGEERLDWLTEQAENAVGYHPPMARPWLKRMRGLLTSDSPTARWMEWTELSLRAEPPCLSDPCSTAPVFAAIDGLARVDARLEILDQVLETALEMGRLEWMDASVRSVLKIVPTARCRAYAWIDRTLSMLGPFSADVIEQVQAELPSELKAVVRARQTQDWIEHGRLNAAWATLQAPLAPPMTCVFEPVPIRSDLLRLLIVDAIDGQRLDIAIPALQQAKAASVAWAPLWAKLAEALSESGQFARLEAIRRAAPDVVALEAAQVRHAMDNGQLARAVALARQPAVRMRLLLALAQATGVAKSHAAIWQSLLSAPP